MRTLYIPFVPLSTKARPVFLTLCLEKIQSGDVRIMMAALTSWYYLSDSMKQFD
jgi:hypothetical protein